MDAQTNDLGFWGSLSLVEAGLVIFLAVFVLISIWALAARRGAFDRVARIPLEDEPVEPRAEPQTPHGARNQNDPKQP